MVRKCASFAFGLVLIAALGFAVAHVHALGFAGESAAFSAPCAPASPAFNAAGDANAVSTLDSTCAGENAGTTTGLARRFHVEALAELLQRVAPETYPPLLHRPPPANS